MLGISVRQPKERQINAVYGLAKSTAAQLTDMPLGIESVQVDDGYVGDGYGLPTKGTFRAIDLAAKFEGLLLDPVYSAMAEYTGSSNSPSNLAARSIALKVPLVGKP